MVRIWHHCKIFGMEPCNSVVDVKPNVAVSTSEACWALTFIILSHLRVKSHVTLADAADAFSCHSGKAEYLRDGALMGCSMLF